MMDKLRERSMRRIGCRDLLEVEKGIKGGTAAEMVRTMDEVMV